MATITFFLGVFCISLSGGLNYHDRNYLNKHGRLLRPKRDVNAEKRISLIRRAQLEIGVRERTGNNDGARVEEYLSVVGLKRGEPYCAAYISWLFAMEGFTKPKSGWCPDLFPKVRLARSALPGNVIGIYFISKKRIAHVGVIEKVEGEWCVSIEANTNVNGSREGDGVYRKRRHLKTIYRISDWVSKERREP